MTTNNRRKARQAGVHADERKFHIQSDRRAYNLPASVDREKIQRAREEWIGIKSQHGPVRHWTRDANGELIQVN